MKQFKKEITYKGIKYKSVYEACKKNEFSYYTVLQRLSRGETVEDAFSKNKLSHRGKYVTVDNIRYRSLNEARRELNPKLDSGTAHERRRGGWTIKQALGLEKYEYKSKKKIKFRGKEYDSHTDLANKFGINPTLFIRRLNSTKYKNKFSIAEALELKKHHFKGFTTPVTLEGKRFKSLTSASIHYGLKIKTISERLQNGWSVEQAFELKKRKGHHPGKVGIIYIIKNKINKMAYVGASFGTLRDRWKWHLEKSKLKNPIKNSIAEAINEFGEKNFEKRILKRGSYVSELSKLERNYIKRYKSQSPTGYNLNTGGFGFGNLGIKVKVNGLKFKTIREAAKYFKIKYHTVISRLGSNWSIEEAFETKVREQKSKLFKQVKIDGKVFNTVKEAAIHYGFKPSTVRNRIFNGWSIEKALKIKMSFGKTIKFNGKTFKSIRKLAYFYKVSPGTLSAKIKKGMSIEKALNMKR